MRRSAADKPVVLLYVEGINAAKRDGATNAKSAMKLLERFMLNEYKALFPNYIVIRSPLDPYEVLRAQEADYLLLLKFHADTNQYNNNWFLTVEQTLTDKDGSLLASGNASKRTSPLAGNILAALEVLSVQKAELLHQLPWMQSSLN